MLDLIEDLFSVKPDSICEKITFWSIVLIIPTWILGGTYIVGSVLGWCYLLILIIRFEYIRFSSFTNQQKLFIVAWICSAVLLFISLIIGHLDYGYSTGAIIKSAIGWAKGWAGFPLYIVAGLLPIKKEILVRAVTINCILILLISPLFFIWAVIGLPPDLYTSPLRVVSPGLEKVFFDLSFYVIDPSTGALKFRIFTPWSPALGMVANIYLWIVLNERNSFYKKISITSVILMCIMSGSRAAIIGAVGIPLLVYLLSKAKDYYFYVGLALIVNIFTIFFDPIFEFIDARWQELRSLRADSSRVRATLSEIGINRWYEESFWWGHGTVERGPKLVEFMPIGSHNSWIALLYVKGFVGFLAFLVPMLLSILYFMIRMLTTKSQINVSAFAIVLILFQYTVSENLEMLIYLYWPGIMFLGVALASNCSSRVRPSV